MIREYSGEIEPGINRTVLRGVLAILFLAFASTLTGAEIIVVPSSNARPYIKAKDAVIKP